MSTRDMTNRVNQHCHNQPPNNCYPRKCYHVGIVLVHHNRSTSCEYQEICAHHLSYQLHVSINKQKLPNHDTVMSKFSSSCSIFHNKIQTIHLININNSIIILCWVQKQDQEPPSARKEQRQRNRSVPLFLGCPWLH